MQSPFLHDKIKITCELLLAQSVVNSIPVTDVQYRKADGYKQDNTIPTDGFEPFAAGQRVRGYDEHFWFTTRLPALPVKPNVQYVLRIATGCEGSWDATNPQGIIYLNGKMSAACDTNHTEVYLEPETEYEFANYMYTGTATREMVAVGQLEFGYTMWIEEIDTRIEHLYYDLWTAFDVCTLQDGNSDEYIQMMAIVEKTANMLDLRCPHSAAYYESLEKAQQYITEELYEKLCTTEGKPVVTCIGHTHIDIEWLWARKQTREKIQRSFSNAKCLMDLYPEYKFTLSQPELYRYLKEEAPEKYEELKQLVADGRWEPEGAMWVESDCNLVSGESFVRQIIHGKRFFEKEFGVDCKVLFLPDVFGYSCALPQILDKSGIRHFVTSKISWNDTNTVPYDTFLWKGIDGTEMLTNFITTQEYAPIPRRGTTYVGHLSASEIKGSWHRYNEKAYTNRVMTTYGWGDGGGGPTKRMLETQRRLAKGMPGMPVTEMGFLTPHLDRVREDFDAACDKIGRVPKWVGELYLEFHRGTYTSMAKNKRGNRYSEFLLGKSEALSQIASYSGGRYEKEIFERYWRKTLHNQFHDIIPGSSILEVYEGTDKDYAEIAEGCGRMIDEQLDHLAARAEGKGHFLYNPLGFARPAVVKVDGATCESEAAVPSFGWMTTEALLNKNDIRIDGLTAENAYYVMTLDNAGRIVRLYDKENDREVFKEGCFGNELQAFEDYPRIYDNWEMTDYYKDKQWTLDDDAEITPFTDGSSAGFRIKRRYLDSTICQTVRLYSVNRRIDFETDIDWYQKHQILKAAFPFDVNTNEATYEIQFGHVTRPTHANTSWEQAKFEVYGHKWVDMSEADYGVALLNDCKYGHSADGSTLKLTILKSGSYPNEQADVGKHTLTYSLLPHSGDFRRGGVVQEAYALNQPMEYRKANGDGSLPAAFSLISCDKENVIIETVKRAEADDATVVRLYDAYNARVNATLTVGGSFTEAYLCDLMENELQPLEFDGKTLTVPVKNFEIVTLKFR